MVRLIPRETKFFDMFVEMAQNLIEGARLMKSLLENYQDVPAQVSKLKDIEHRGDDLTHAVITKLNQTFITPFDREDIHRLASSLDDVLDLLNAAGDRMIVYKIQAVPKESAVLAGLILQQSEELARAVAVLEKQHQSVLQHCVEINRLENEADRVTRDAVGRLFESEKDPIQLIKIKELYEVLELATDKAEDAANVLESVILKSA
jgi:predicted phosphate transport protein (TIGR00153 family)